MKRQIFLFIIGIFIIGLSAISICIAQDSDTVHYYNPKGHFSLTLPNGWEEIPQNVIEEYVKLMQEQATESITMNYEAGFQLEDSPEWFTYPYIVIQINQKGKVPEAEFQKYMLSQKGKETMEKGATEVKEAFPLLINNLKFGESTYDRTKHIFFTKVRINVAYVGNTTGISAICLSKEGYVQINFYSLEQDFQKYLLYFEELINSFKFDKGYEYKRPTFFEKFSIPKILIAALRGYIKGLIIGALIAAITVGTGYIVKKKRGREQKIRKIREE